MFFEKIGSVLEKLSSLLQRIQVGNGQYFSVLFVIPIIVNISGHIFEIYTLVSEIVLGIKNMFELEGIISSADSTYYEFELVEKLCDQYNNLINTLKNEQNIDTGEKYPWLDDSDERKHMADREILEKYINLDNTCLTEKRKEGSYGYVI